MTEMQTILLTVLRAHTSSTSGLAVADIGVLIGRQPGHDSDRQHSALLSKELCELERAGLVARLDDEKPIVWRIA